MKVVGLYCVFGYEDMWRTIPPTTGIVTRVLIVVGTIAITMALPGSRHVAKEIKSYYNNYYCDSVPKASLLQRQTVIASSCRLQPSDSLFTLAFSHTTHLLPFRDGNVDRHRTDRPKAAHCFRVWAVFDARLSVSLSVSSIFYMDWEMHTSSLNRHPFFRQPQLWPFWKNDGPVRYKTLTVIIFWRYLFWQWKYHGLISRANHQKTVVEIKSFTLLSKMYRYVMLRPKWRATVSSANNWRAKAIY